MAVEAILAVLLALSSIFGSIVYKNNLKLSDEINRALNNVIAYLGIVNDALDANYVLLMNIDELKDSNDKLLQKVDSVMKDNKIKPKSITTAATQTQSLLVSQSKGVGGLIIVKDTIYTDSIYYNPLTKVYYSIGNDSISIALDVSNTLYLYTYKNRVYKNNKSFIKRLFTFDFKKVDRYLYKIVNTNDLIKESDVRIIEN